MDYHKEIEKLYSLPELYDKEFENYTDDIYFRDKIVQNLNHNRHM